MINRDTDIHLLANPSSGRSSKRAIQSALNLLRGKGFNVDLRITGYRGHAEQIARSIAEENNYSKGGNNRLVIAAGGDGTYNEIANGLVYSGIPMAILPMGTTSVLARELMIPFNLESAVDTLINGKVIDVSMGLIECCEGGQIVKRFFLLMAGIGFDGETVRSVDAQRKRMIGKLAYIMSGLSVFISCKAREILVTAEGLNEPSFRCTNIIVGKGSFYGGPFRITPDARLTVPSFFSFATKGAGRFNLLRYIFGVVLDRHRQFKDTRYFESPYLKLDGDASIQIDGDYIGHLPSTVKVAEGSIRLVVNKDFIA